MTKHSKLILKVALLSMASICLKSVFKSILLMDLRNPFFGADEGNLRF